MKETKNTPVIELLYGGSDVENVLPVYYDRDASTARLKVTRTHLSFAICVRYICYFLITSDTVIVTRERNGKKYLYAHDLLYYFKLLLLNSYFHTKRDFLFLSIVH